MLQLRQYQQDDLDKLLTLNSAGVFSEQRTGKTPVAIHYAIAKSQHKEKILIICPPSAIPGWKNEWERWAPSYNCVAVMNAKNRAKKAAIINSWKEVLIVSYDTLKETKTHEGFTEEIKGMSNGMPGVVIIDEAHRIQSRSSNATSAVYSFRKAKYKLALTGTPAPNKPYQIFSILRWLYPDIFTSYWKYIDEFYDVKIERNWKMGTNFRTILGFKNDEAARQHAEIIDRIAVQRKRIEVMPWLPPKQYIRIPLQATAMQERAIMTLHKYFEVGSIDVAGTLDALIRERQICNCPQSVEVKSMNPKVEWIIQYLKDYPTEKVIIFSSFTATLKELGEAIKKYNKDRKFEYFTGETNIKRRGRIVEEFQFSTLIKNEWSGPSILLIQTQAGKEAITLDAAETAIFVDKYPPVGAIQQAEDRFVATTFEKSQKQHCIIELYIKGTYDEALYDLIQQNKTLTDVVNDYKNYLSKGEK